MADKIKITFLGTGSAIPTAKRNHTSILLRYKDENILVDCGEGTQRQFRKAKLNPCKITKILITHWHGDHVLGLPGLLQTLMLNGYNKILEIYGPTGTKKMMQLYTGMFAHKKTAFQIKVKEVRGVFFDSEDFFIEARQMDHGVPSVAYSLTIKEKQRVDKEKLKKLKIPNSPLLGKIAKGEIVKIDGKKIDGNKLLYKEKKRKVSFILDTRENQEAEIIAKNSDILICEATYSKDETGIADKHFHLTSTQAAKIAKKSKSKRLILTHLSQRYETKQQQQQILEEAKSVFLNVKIANDFDTIEI